MTTHLDDLRLSDLLDGRLDAADRNAALVHLAGCTDCTGEWRALGALWGEARLLREVVATPPPAWPLVAARTVYRTEVRRRALRALWVPLVLWSLATFAAGVATTELVRGWSRRVAESAWRANRLAEPLRRAPAPGGRS